MNGFAVYFLQSEKDGTIYIGQTNDVAKRIERHNKGLIRSTKHRVPLHLIYSETHNTRREAMIREKHLKSIGGVKEKKAIINKIVAGL